ncbi:hypothetical protein GOARA_063_00540 [Gordonia araii NBRC 100433]|uniref:Uncharacterized protein n=1 Tax=Gordonia araii NBRC 100433 TaxID=1073574 RepID=G7H4T0_9ACTN|nr:hypothetical protein [Gordonia araii]NNG98004.1 hypothetical protein [Gordonia araii NBRC 100433]GAB10855.1 hypothetical protein GOARA_063_00540 [Gordonia araii NBRC 100433]
MKPTFERDTLPGVLRTRLTATRQLTNDLANAEFVSSPVVWVAVLPGALIVPMLAAGSLFGLVMGGPSMWQYHTITSVSILVASPVIGAIILIGLPVVGSLGRGRGRWAAQLPAGSLLYADFGEEWIGCGWDGTYQTVMLAHLKRVRRVSRVLVLSGGDTPLLIPESLVPEHIKAGLLSGQWRLRAQASPPAHQPIYPGPEVLSPAADTVHVEAVADGALADRLARASRRSSAASWAVGLMVSAPLVMVALVWMSQGSLDWLTMLPIISVCGSGGAVLGYSLLRGTKAHLQQLVPQGAPIVADYGPDWLGVRLGSHVQTVQKSNIKRVNDIDGVLVLTLRGLQTGILIPREVVPEDISRELLSLGRGRN